jgi:hypothetical protein
MPKKNQDFVKEPQDAQQQGNVKPSQIKKSRSAEDLTPKSQTSPEVKELQAQVLALTEQITRIKQDANQQIKFETNKAQNYLEQITKLTAEVTNKDTTIKELTETKNKLTDQNNELRLVKLKANDYQKELIKTQQDLKTAQQIIELRLTKTDSQEIDY